MLQTSDKIDLHMHTTISDGTDRPEEILLLVNKAGLELFSVTDHDAFKGCSVIQALRTAEDPAFLNGVEFSCKDEEGKYHILGYGFDLDAEAIRKVVEEGHRLRINKVRKRLDFLEKEYGFAFPPEELKKLMALDNPGKPHIGNLMVKYGYAKTKEEAIKKYINRLRFQQEYVRPKEAIEAILESGGIPVLAHPSYGNGDQLILGDEMNERLLRLMGFGLQGVEAFYSGFTAKLRDQILGFAKRYGLYVTAGSDYHGANKLIPIGDTGFGNHPMPEGMQRFLEDIRNKI